MEAISYSRARQHLAEVMDKVSDDRAPVMITRESGRPVVVLSLEEYNALEETSHLLRSPRNAKRLLESIEQLERDGGKVRRLARDAD